MINNVSNEQFKTLMTENPDATILDVRTPDEYAGGIIPGAVNINVMDPGFYDRFSDFDKEAPVLVYCRSGARSFRAASILESLGFTDLHNLSGGIMFWDGKVEVPDAVV